jgi:hypothetical protein
MLQTRNNCIFLDSVACKNAPFQEIILAAAPRHHNGGGHFGLHLVPNVSRYDPP